MNYRSSLLIAILLLLATFTAHGFTPGYQITGSVTGLPDSTWLYLRTHETIDSCQVTNGTFSMSGRIPEQAVRVFLHTKNFTHYLNFWLENSRIRIAVKAGQFKKGIITGSVTEAENKRLVLSREPINKQTDSLNRVLEVTQDAGARKNLLSQLRNLNEQRQQLDKDWIKSHPASPTAADLLNVYATSWGKATTQALYNTLSPTMKATRYGREIQDYLALYKSLKIGDRYVDFEQPNPVGTLVKFSQVRGKYILLDFWASWCGPCLEENSLLKDIYTRYQDKGFAILGVSLDNNKASWLKVIASGKLTWENVTDLRGDKNRAALLYGISGIPDNFLIDQNGIIIARNLRGKKLDETLKQLLP